MERLNLKEDLQVDNKLEKIWSDYYSDKETTIAPLYQMEVLKNVITFLSINPSLTPSGKKDATKGYYPHPPYSMINYETTNILFFRKFYEIGEELNQPWTMLDLLYERESAQSDLEIKYSPKTIKESDKNFLLNQIKLTFEIFENIKPKVVVISNAGTDKLIHSNLKDLGIIQELPCKKNGFVYKLNGIPFISNESRFLGSRQHFIRSKKDGRFEKLVHEIKRVINIK